MRWLEVRVSADTEAVEAVSELFARYGYQGGVAIEEQYLQDRDGDNLRVDTTAPVIVATYIADTPAAQETIYTLKQALPAGRRRGSRSQYDCAVPAPPAPSPAPRRTPA